MEKIYDESQQQKNQQQQKKKIKIDSVTMLSFAVAIFAVVSLVAAGVSGFSFALPEEVVTLPTTFTGTQDNDMKMKDNVVMTNMRYHYYNNGTTEIPLLCLQRDIDFASGTFQQTGSGFVSNDAGLLYLLANLTPNANFTYPAGFNIPDGTKKYVDFWISQMAVWYYLNGKDSNSIGSSDFNNVVNIPWVAIGTDSNDINDILTGNTCSDDSKCFGFVSENSTSPTKKIFDEVKVGSVSIKQLVTNANGKSGMAYDIHLSSGDGTIHYDQNKEYYFSPLYTVVSSIDSSIGELTSYALTVTATDKDNKSVDVSGVITDQDGNVISDVSALTPSQLSAFYVRVPVNKVTENVTVHVGINATFRMYEGIRYKVQNNDNSQEVTTVQFANKVDQDGTNFDLAPAPDTGISAGQTIYFVGLIVLLCGVGIIYANAKPKAQAQE